MNICAADTVIVCVNDITDSSRILANIQALNVGVPTLVRCRDVEASAHLATYNPTQIIVETLETSLALLAAAYPTDDLSGKAHEARR